jgi:hypothetical protein
MLIKEEDVIRELWKDGPVHMVKEGYQLLCSKLLDQILDIKLCRKSESKKEKLPPAPDRTKMRKHWVVDNDSAVHRRYEDDPQAGIGRGGWRGRGGWPRYRGPYKGGRSLSLQRSRPY